MIRHRSSLVAAALVLAASPVAAQGQLEIVHAFDAPPALVNGYVPSAPPVVTLSGVYGTTLAGGTFNQGTIYRLTTAGLTTVHHFTGATGGHPMGALAVGTDGRLYGTTLDGGTEGRGTVFRISALGEFQVLHSFTAAEGRYPTGGLVRATDGNFWGTTLLGGSADAGTVFKISPAGAFVQVRSFGDTFALADIVWPFAPMIQASDGNFYGTTYGRVPSGVGGAVYKLTPTGEMTTLFVFSTLDPLGAPARLPAGVVEGLDGWLYGGACCASVTSIGGVVPSLFRVSKAGVYQDLMQTSQGDRREIVRSLTLGSDGGLYGATTTGILFRIDGAGTFTQYRQLSAEEGVTVAGLRAIAPGWFIGSALEGGPNGGGTLFLFRPF